MCVYVCNKLFCCPRGPLRKCLRSFTDIGIELVCVCVREFVFVVIVARLRAHEGDVEIQVF